MKTFYRASSQIKNNDENVKWIGTALLKQAELSFSGSSVAFREINIFIETAQYFKQAYCTAPFYQINFIGF